MARPLRSELFEPDAVGVYHCFNRCVRRAYLCGVDPVSQKDFSHRKEWFKRRLSILVKHFHLDLMAFSLLSNHFHLVLRNRPDSVARLTDRQVAQAWLMICPRSRRRADGSPVQPTAREVNLELARPERIAELRERLSNPSWLIRLLCQYMGQQCNAEDQQKGKFFESRFMMTRLLDEPAVLACLAYVDLNPLRAGLCESLEEYEFVSIGQRLRTLDGEEVDGSEWLSPLTIQEETDGQRVQVANDLSAEQVQQHREARRRTLLGCAPIDFEEYLRLLRWLCPKKGEESAAPAERPEILQRQGLDAAAFAEVVRDFPAYFSTAAGCTASLVREAQRRGRCRLRAAGGHTLDPVEPA